MKHIKNSFVAFVGMFLIVTTVTAFIPTLTQGQKSNIAPNPPTLNVEVVNAPSEPVPVAGTININNLSTDPIPVRDVDISARLPVQFNELYTVPSGRRLVIEYISIDVAASAMCGLMTAALKQEGIVLHLYNPTFVGILTIGPSTAYKYGLSQETRAYIGPNRTVTLGLHLYTGCFAEVHHASGTGYLENL